MAKKVTLEELAFADAKAKHLKLLGRFVEQHEASNRELVREVLERSVNEGNKKLRAEAFALFARFDLERAEALALASADVAARVKKKAERDALLAPLLVVSTSPCLQRADEEGLDVQTLEAWQLVRAPEWSRRRLGAERSKGSSVAWLERNIPRWSPPDGAELALFVSLVDEHDTLPEERALLLKRLVEVGHVATSRRRDLPEAVLVRAAFNLPTEECFERATAALVSASPETVLQSVAAFAAPPDPRWVDFLLARFQTVTERLAALRALCTAAHRHANDPTSIAAATAIGTLALSSEWDGRLMAWLLERKLLSAAHAPLCLRAVEQASANYNDWGHRSLCSVLNLLARCGRVEDITPLKQLAAHVAEITQGSQAPAAWFAQAIATLEAQAAPTR